MSPDALSGSFNVQTCFARYVYSPIDKEARSTQCPSHTEQLLNAPVFEFALIQGQYLLSNSCETHARFALPHVDWFCRTACM